MGANQSSDGGRNDATREGLRPESKTCYYELLGISSNASEDEIKKAYHRKALEAHPDRNYGHVEAATKRFADIQSAYEVLSDPQERVWYDSHREFILRGDDYGEENFQHNIRVTTADDVTRFITKVDFRVDPSAPSREAFTIIKDFFDGLAKEEEVASKWKGLEPIQYPSFGQRDDSQKDVVKPFYSMWAGFATTKSFSWKEIYRYSEAPDRRVRRIMEKENKRHRDDGTREFNDAVRSLVAFVRKRDPRLKTSKRDEANRQQVLRDAAVAQAARSRAANQAKLAEEALPEWINPITSEAKIISDDETAENDLAREEVECVVCNKTFKSEKQYEAHERSKKHVKAVQQLRRQMLKENQDLNLQGSEKSHNLSNGVTSEVKEVDLDGEGTSLDHINLKCDQNSWQGSAILHGDENRVTRMSPKPRFTPSIIEPDRTPEGHYNLRQDFEPGIFDGNDEGVRDDKLPEHNIDDPLGRDFVAQPIDASAINVEETAKKPKMGRAKEKRAKKAAQNLTLTTEFNNELSCATCLQRFTSKNQLFKHIKLAEHAQSTENQRQSKG